MRSLSWDACISESALRVWATWTAATGLTETTHLILCLAHRNGSDHLNRIRRGGLPKLSACSPGHFALLLLCFSGLF